ncbi:MAG: hypothetical protein KatS3mg105_4550 [Gemmatales bacterium]|nr:MAG: hypothetical protein KatS3mg105_4550 [Gemmatales bacterium]
MSELAIGLAEGAEEGPCSLCGQQVSFPAGLRVMTSNKGSVCRNCAKQHVPTLVALMDLASTAERIGKIVQHNHWLPLKSHLEMAQAAERYASALTPTCREAS